MLKYQANHRKAKKHQLEHVAISITIRMYEPAVASRMKNMEKKCFGASEKENQKMFFMRTILFCYRFFLHFTIISPIAWNGALWCMAVGSFVVVSVLCVLLYI